MVRANMKQLRREGERRSLWPMLLAVLALSGVATSGVASAGTLQTLYSFCTSTCYDGLYPGGGVITDTAGNLYGTTTDGGVRNAGTVFELTWNSDKQQWVEHTLYNFCDQCTDGGYPNHVHLVIDTAGNLYGTTSEGGSEMSGTVFELIPRPKGRKWIHKILHNFCTRDSACSDGIAPFGGLTYAGAESGAPYDGVSSLYGVTSAGGEYHNGVAYSLTLENDGPWKTHILYAFCKEKGCKDGASPNALIADSGGDLFGTTQLGGKVKRGKYPKGAGIVFELAPTGTTVRWSESVLHSFCSTMPRCADGAAPYGLVMDTSGNLFGTTSSGGPKNTGCYFTSCGVIYEIAVGGNERTLYAFCGCQEHGYEQAPYGSLVVDGAGNLFGTTTGSFGTIFEYSAGSVETLYSFCELGCQNGSDPQDALLMDSSGNLFGITGEGQTYNRGTVFEYSTALRAGARSPSALRHKS